VAVKNWIYFATAEKTSLASTIETVINAQFLWRSAFNERGAQIANVGALEKGDHIIVAWRHSGVVRTAYLECTVAGPFSPAASGLVIDKLRGTDAQALVAAGYPTNSAGEVEGIRLDEIRECYFQVRGTYGGNNAIHKLAAEDAGRLSIGSRIPPGALNKPGGRIRSKEARLQVPIAPSARITCAVDNIELEATNNSRVFDAYVMVDWSSNSSPVIGNDSIWIASGAWSDRTFISLSPQNVPTRLQAVEILREKLLLWRKEGKRVLVGLDFAFGYPAGFADALGLTSVPRDAWKALHEHFAANVEDSIQNAHNRDSFADECNRRVGAPGPFWGCAAKSATRSLTQQRIGVFQFPHHGLEEWRATDLAARRRVTTQSVWKLNCGVSVGGQTILGIKHLDRLAHSVNGHRWPFEGWGTPDVPAIWFAEIFPSLVLYPEWGEGYKTQRDRTQVQGCVRYAAERDATGVLKRDFAKPNMLDSATLGRVEGEEGWILWV
jgi:hypothetical protein